MIVGVMYVSINEANKSIITIKIVSFSNSPRSISILFPYFKALNPREKPMPTPIKRAGISSIPWGAIEAKKIFKSTPVATTPKTYPLSTKKKKGIIPKNIPKNIDNKTFKTLLKKIINANCQLGRLVSFSTRGLSPSII